MTFDARLIATIAVAISCFAIDATGDGGAPRVTFISEDRKTAGDWSSKYGKDGFIIVDDAKSLPPYVRISVLENRDTVIKVETDERRVLHRGKEPTKRIAAHWYCWSRDEFTIDLRFTDTDIHGFSIYSMDWNRSGWIEKIEFLDPLSRKVLNSQTLSDFGEGVYLTWNVTGHVTIRVSGVKDEMASISGIFFDPPATKAVTPNSKVEPK